MLSINEYLKAGETTVSNLVIENYQKIGLTDEEFLFWLQLFRSQVKGDLFPDLAEISQIMGKSIDVIYKLMNQLVSRGFLIIETKQNDQGQMMDTYDLLPIFEKIDLLQQKQTEKQKEMTSEETIKQLYQGFEKEFGRQLSPIELEMIGQWLETDHYQPELIRLALREAVLNQAYSLKYIDRILLAWERKNITTKEQVAEDQKRRKQALIQKEIEEQGAQSEPIPKVTLHNWLNPEDSE
ncbi:DnaD domain-containing protein [Enterococcus haemoperoxidus ATCC BAA-382]|uniref:DNA replication protein DnaD n=1 Tax=Enterococcus haemoperoxidus ATCC BAA-382 TaxID=1158608 RepID=R2QTW0_9ENTE|nr:DnaD domain protein [Enterococcus haemoperoxidus]EOH98743.1 DnaD domain-containing protein [Enterococcus haemoperoxidus ATCC BAA-382]EOT62074.1 DNA replication protein DnaD [Enterococcus haemoperoxidus ATCC BAA-382]OJG55847.1 DnaD domain-containing protein [Enterococcus haemoperoxidus]